MLRVGLEISGEDLCCVEQAEGGATVRRPLTAERLDKLRDWACRYDKSVRSGDNQFLAGIGQEISALLNEGDSWLDRTLDGTGEIQFEVAVSAKPTEPERMLLDVPWELLTHQGLFLAADEQRLFRVTRRLGKAADPAAPSFRDVALLFMAAEVEGESVLNYEHEESAILQATKAAGLGLAVEESGSREYLGQRLAQDGPFEALHLSCHGEILKGEPVLALERSEGGLDLTKVSSLSDVLGEDGQKPALVFLSACRTAEHGTAAASFAQLLVRSGVPNALGWDGSVYDENAILFAQTFYKQCADGRSVGHAVAQAQRTLLRAHLVDPDRKRGRHWHLARLYLGSRGGGALCASNKPKRTFRRDPGHQEFLDRKGSRVPVATAAEFVGRRRQAQRVLRAFRDQEGAGVLIQAMGSQGKSSLAARIANRMPGHETVVVFGR